MRRFGTHAPLCRRRPACSKPASPARACSSCCPGHVAITQRDGLGHVTPVVEQGPGQFLAEIGHFRTGPRSSMVMPKVSVETLLIPPDQLRALMVAEADLGERIMRALILRRVSLIQEAVGGPVLIGSPMVGRHGAPAGLPHPQRLSAPSARSGRRSGGGGAGRAPRADARRNCRWLSARAAPCCAIRARASWRVTSAWSARPASATLYDVAIVGSGPAGLVDGRVCGVRRPFRGGARPARLRRPSRRQRPHRELLRLPDRDLGPGARRPRFHAGAEVRRRGDDPGRGEDARLQALADGAFGIELDGGERLRARSVVVASGARYRRPAIENLSAFEGRGVWYWASPIEAKIAAGQDVIIVGGGNSAGQAAVFLSGHAAKVRVMIRGEGLAASMSSYLIDRIAAAPNIEVMMQTEIAALDGNRGGRPRAGALARPPHRRRDRRQYPQRVSVCRRRPGDGLARWLRRQPRSQRLCHDRSAAR